MIVRQTARLALVRATRFSTAPRLPFPYKFGNTETFPAVSAQAFAAGERNLGLITGAATRWISGEIAAMYRKMLVAVQNQDGRALDDMLEYRFYERLTEDSKRWKGAEHRFLLMNPESEVKVTPKAIWFVVGSGDIDRGMEDVIYAQKLDSDMLNRRGVALYYSAFASKNKVIMKIQAEVRTSLKLIAENTLTGRTLLPSWESRTEEVHELCVEGVTAWTWFSALPLRVGTLLWMLGRLKWGNKFAFEDPAVVDLDRALGGNCHKGSVDI